MKKLYFIIIFCLLLVSKAMSQEATKQETMDWIASKLQKYLIKQPEGPDYRFEYRQFYSYADGKFIYKRNYESDDEKDCGFNLILINLNNVTGYDIGSSYLQIRGNDLITIFNSKSTCGGSDLEEKSSVMLTKTNGNNTFELEIENDLLIRTEKAIKHLINFNTKSRGEKF